MYEILVPVDENEGRAAEQVNAIAALPGAEENVRVLLVHVFEDNPEGGSVGRVVGVRAASKRLDEAGIEHDQVGTSGDPAEMILREATERDVDLICVGGRRRSPAGKALFGSVAQRVILNADQPVLTTRVNGSDD